MGVAMAVADCGHGVSQRRRCKTMVKIPNSVQAYADELDAVRVEANPFPDGREKYEIYVQTLKQDISHFPDGYTIYGLGNGCVELAELQGSYKP